MQQTSFVQIARFRTLGARAHAEANITRQCLEMLMRAFIACLDDNIIRRVEKLMSWLPQM